MKIKNIKRFKVPMISQIALGLTDIDANPDLISILQSCRYKGIVPNFTMTGYGLTPEYAERFAELAGAIAISAYPHTKELAYNTVKTMTDLGMDQINIHLLYHAGNKDFVYEVLADTQNDPRLDKLHAVVLLALKKRGRAESGFEPMAKQDFTKLIEYCFKEDIHIGFDSCTAPKFEDYVNQSSLPESRKLSLLQMSEPCESALMSSYINVHGDFYPCSFMEGIDSWENGISVLDHDCFVDGVWHHPRVEVWRERLLENNRNCPVFEV